MVAGVDYEGSLLLDVDGPRLDGRFIDRDGVVGDHFQIVHGIPAPCCDGVDDDGDGLAGYPDDPGCTSEDDETELAPELPCDDGIDDDGDGRTDFPEDVGCENLVSSTESPACSDGLDNDEDGQFDFDGGSWVNGGVPLGDPDRTCKDPWQQRETRRRSCGFGLEVALLLPLLLSATGRGRPFGRRGSRRERGGAPSRGAP
jgi:hypothetical protein